MARVLGLKQLLQRKYTFLENLPPEIIHSFGQLTRNFIMIIWGLSGNGKSNLMMQLLRAFMPFGKVLYVGLEEGFEASMQMNVLRHLSEEDAGKIEFADHEMTYDALVIKLKKKKSPRFIIIDSVQYWNISYEQYKRLKEMFPSKSFIFISHAKGKEPDGKTAEKIRYDAPIKVHVVGYIAFVVSRYGGNKPYVIWEEGAKKFWGNKYKKTIGPRAKPREENEETPLHKNQPLEEPGQLVLGESQEQHVERQGEGVLPQLAGEHA